MTVTATPTTRIVELNGVPARIWEAKTESGIPFFMFVTRVAVLESHDDSELARELKRARVPSPDAEAFDPRMVL